METIKNLPVCQRIARAAAICSIQYPNHLVNDTCITIRSDQISQNLSPIFEILGKLLRSENCHKVGSQPSDLAHIK